MAPNLWDLDGFIFRLGSALTSRERQIFTAVLTQDTFFHAGLPHGQATHLRFATNLRIIFEVVNHFSRFWGATNFWERIRHILCFSMKTTAQHLFDILAAFCRARREYCRAYGMDADFTPLELLADSLNGLSYEFCAAGKRDAISQPQWQDLGPSWLAKLEELKCELGILEEQVANGTCHPDLRKLFPASAVQGKSPPNRPSIDRISALPGQSHGRGDGDRKARASSHILPSSKPESEMKQEQQHQAGLLPKPPSPLSGRDSVPEARVPEAREHDAQLKSNGATQLSPDLVPSTATGEAGEIGGNPWPKTLVQTDQAPLSLSAPGKIASPAGKVPENSSSHASPSQPKTVSRKRSRAEDEQETQAASKRVAPSTVTTQCEEGPKGQADISSVPTSHPISPIYEPCLFGELSRTTDKKEFQLEVAKSSDAVEQLLVNLEMRQKYLEDMEASMRAWHQQFVKHSSLQAQERIDQLETQVRELSGQLKQRSIDAQQIENVKDSIKRLLGQDQNATFTRLAYLESQAEASKKGRESQQEQMIAIEADMMSLTGQVSTLSEERQTEPLRRAIRVLEARLDTHEKNTKRAHQPECDHVKELEEHHMELKEEVARRSLEFEDAVKKLVEHAGAPEKDVVKKLCELREDLDSWSASQSKRSKSLKERTNNLTSTVEGLRKTVEHLSSLQEANEATVPPSSIQRLATLEEAVEAIRSQPQNKPPLKRVATLETKVEDMQIRLGRNDIQKQINDLGEGLGALEHSLNERPSVQRIDRLEGALDALRSSVSDMPAVEEELREVRTYVDHSLEMSKASTRHELAGFRKQIDTCLDRVQSHSCQIEQLRTPSTAVDKATIDIHGIDTAARLQGCERGLSKQNNQGPQPSRLISPSISDLESIAGQTSDPKELLVNLVTSLKNVYGVMKNKVQDMDHTDEQENEEESCLAEVAYEVDLLVKFTKETIQRLA